MAALDGDRSSAELAAYFAALSGQHVGVCVEGRQVLVSTDIAGCRITIARRNLEHFDVEVDPCFFDPGYTIAGSTGFLLWESNWFLLKLLREGPLAARLSGCRVVDLGSGPGLAGIAAAASGAHVLLTDLPSVVDELLSRNVTRNARSAGSSGTANYEAPAACYTSATAIEGSWAGAQRIGLGSAATMPLDWTASIHQQAASNPNDPRHADYILAADTIWLKDIFHSFVHTVVELLRSGAKACLLAFVERAAEGSKLFVHREAVTEAFELAGCSVDVVHTQDVLIDGVPKPGQVLEIRLCDAAST